VFTLSFVAEAATSNPETLSISTNLEAY